MPAPLSRSVGMASHSQNGSEMYLRAKIGGSEFRVLIDTGANASIIPKSLWLNLTNGGGDLLEYLGDAAAANGGPMCVVGRWQTVCQLDSLALVAELLVADVPTSEILLGYDFLSKYGAVVDVGNRCCHLLGRKFPLTPASDVITPQVVTVHADAIVPPRSEFIIPGAVEGLQGECTTGMMEPLASLSKHCDVFVARVICNVNQGRVPVRVINVTEDPLILKQGMKIGTLFTDITVMDSIDDRGEELSGMLPCSGNSLIKELGLEERGLSPAQLQSVYDLLHRHASVFSTSDTDLGRTHLTTHSIDTGDAKPIKMVPRRVPLHLQQEVADHIKQMQENGIIRPSCSPWAAPIVPVRMKGGKLRFCVDYRRLNDVTAKDAYPLPRIDDALDSLANATLFSTLDLASGYWQVEVDPQDRPKTAFATRQGLFEFNVLSFGLCNAPSTFQRLMDLVLADLQWTTCLVYLDDIIVFGRTFPEHLSRLDEVLTKLGAANLKVKPSKCDLFSSQVKYLGHIISAEGIRADPAKVESVREWPVPKNQTEVKSFVGLASYYRRFVKGFADIARPLHRLTEKGRRFKWGDDCQQAFMQLKSSLITAPVLAYPDPQKRFILDTDASDVGIGAVLSQEEGGVERVVAYASRALTKEERRYATTKKELLAMVTFTKFFKHYLLGKQFVLRTDHGSLRWLHNFRDLEGQLARWVEQLANFNYEIVHRPGKQHANADALSRLPAFVEGVVNQVVISNVTDSQATSNMPERAATTQQQGSPREDLGDELAQAQQQDDEISQLLRLKGDNGVRQAELQCSPSLRKYVPVWDQLTIQDHRLVRVPPSHSDAAAKIQVVLPRSMVPTILSTLHNTVTGGHLGIQKLQAKVKDRFYWPGWFRDVKQWCRECVDCASRKDQGRPPCAPLASSVPSRPYERIALDVLGPLPETQRKNKYVLVIGDYFSKWTEAFPMPNQEAHTVARIVAEEWVCRFGAPRSIHSDQGRNFESNLFKELCRLLDVNKTRTSPYHPQSDGLIERFNRTLLTMLSLFVDSNQLNWDSLLPYVMMAYRSSVHASTGFTPYKVLFGQEIVLPVDVVLGVAPKDKFTSVSDYVTKTADTLSTVVEAVKRHQATASKQQKANFDFRANFQYYSAGELVWVQNKSRKRGLCPKLQRRYKGPYKVLERVTDVLYRLDPGEGKPDFVMHFNRLKPFVSGSLSETMETPAGPVRGFPLRGSAEVPVSSSWVPHHRAGRSRSYAAGQEPTSTCRGPGAGHIQPSLQASADPRPVPGGPGAGETQPLPRAAAETRPVPGEPGAELAPSPEPGVNRQFGQGGAKEPQPSQAQASTTGKGKGGQLLGQYTIPGGENASESSGRQGPYPSRIRGPPRWSKDYEMSHS